MDNNREKNNQGSFSTSSVPWENSSLFHFLLNAWPRPFFQKTTKKKLLASRHPTLTGPDVTCFSFIHSAVTCWDVCVGTMPGRCRRLWWAHGWKTAEEKITCHSESVRTPPEATTPPSMSSSPCFPPLAPALHECSFSVWLCVLFVRFQFTYLVVHSGLSASSTCRFAQPVYTALPVMLYVGTHPGGDSVTWEVLTLWMPDLKAGLRYDTSLWSV